MDDQPQAQNEEVEETTAEESPTTETEEATETEAEETPDSEESGDETPEVEAEAEAEQPTTEEKPKQGRAQKRIRSLATENKALKEQIAASQPAQPQGQPTQQQAQQALASVNQTIQQTGQLPSEISQAEYQSLVQLANGQQMAQTDAKTSQLESQVYELQRNQQINDLVQKFDTDVRSRIDKYDEIRRGTDSYDEDLDDYIHKSLEEDLKENPRLDTGKAIDRYVGIYRKARKQGGEKVSATLAKQAAGSAQPLGSSKGSKRSEGDKTLEELEQEIGTTGTTSRI